MQKEKHFDTAVLMYFGFLLFIVLINLISKVSFIDLVYLFVVVCCVFKYFIIVRDSKR